MPSNSPSHVGIDQLPISVLIPESMPPSAEASILELSDIRAAIKQANEDVEITCQRDVDCVLFLVRALAL